MKKLPRVKTAEQVIHGVLKLVFVDGYEGVLDLRPMIAKGKIFSLLQNPEHFSRVQVEEYGHSIAWVDDTGCEVDLGADSLRRDCERQAAVHELMTA